MAFEKGTTLTHVFLDLVRALQDAYRYAGGLLPRVAHNPIPIESALSKSGLFVRT